MRLLFIDTSTNLEQVNDLQKKGRGGRVGSLFKVSDYLSWAGHKVTVLSDIENTGVTKYGTIWDCEAYGEYDCLIANRGIGDGYSEIKAKSRILWTHDLPHSGFIPDPRNIRGFNATVFMSAYGERVWRTFYKDIGRSVQIPNGVTKDLFFDRGHKDLDYLIYISAPNRGLDKLQFIFDCIQERIDRPLRMKAFSNLKSLHPGEFDEDQNTVLKDGYTLGHDSDKQTVELCDPVPQDVLAKELSTASLMIMPTPFPEICSNAVLQSLASGTPIITTGGLGATPEWVKHRKNGMLTDFITNDYMVHTVQMIRNACEVLEDQKLHRRMIKNATKTRIYSWKEIGEKWNRLIKSCV